MPVYAQDTLGHTMSHEIKQWFGLICLISYGTYCSRLPQAIASGFSLACFDNAYLSFYVSMKKSDECLMVFSEVSTCLLAPMLSGYIGMFIIWIYPSCVKKNSGTEGGRYLNMYRHILYANERQRDPSMISHRLILFWAIAGHQYLPWMFKSSGLRRKARPRLMPG